MPELTILPVVVS